MLKNTRTPATRPPPPRRRPTKTAAVAVEPAKNQPSRFVYKPEVIDRVGMTYVSIWRLMTRGDFPLSREVGNKAAWLGEDIEKWIAERPVRKIKKAEERS